MIKKLILTLGVFAALVGCENQDIAFDDYKAQTVYFPIQYPVRTLALGESRYDNTIDLQHAFSIGVGYGGAYANTKDRVVKIELAPELADSIQTGAGNEVKILPSTHYEAMSFDQIVIPSGEFSGKIKVQLTDAFFADTLATDVNYVIPLRITEETEDSVLCGWPLSEVTDPDPRKPEHWNAGYLPKDYTLFAIKYINSMHGVYFLRGKVNKLDAQGGNNVDTTVYHSKYNTEDFAQMLTTVSLTENTITRLGGSDKNGVTMNLVFDETNKSINILPTDAGVSTPVSGTGTYVNADDPAADVYAEIGHRTLFLDYEYELNGTFYHAMDTLVYRDNNLTYEEFSIVFP